MTPSQGKLLFPRLPIAPARDLLASLGNLDTAALIGSAALQHASAAPAPVGGHPASERHLRNVQEAVRAAATRFGFPAKLSGRDQAAFDRECASVLFATADIVPGDAASAEVWSFVSLVLLPEIPFWRFPGGADERFVGGDRNTFQRLWWRARTLGPDLSVVPHGATPFGEDDFVQVMERPTVSGNERLARTFYNVVLESDLARLGMTRSVLVRRLVVQIRARRNHIAVDALTSDELTRMIRQIRDSLSG